MFIMFEMLNIKCANNIVTFTCIAHVYEDYHPEIDIQFDLQNDLFLNDMSSVEGELEDCVFKGISYIRSLIKQNKNIPLNYKFIWY